LFVETKKAHKWRDKKDDRHEIQDGCINIDYTVNQKDGYTVGRFFLFGDKQVQELAAIIDNKKKEFEKAG
jgi:hypothetical protein